MRSPWKSSLAAAFAVVVCGALVPGAFAAPLSLLNPDFNTSATGEESSTVPTDWTATGFIRTYNLNVDGDGDPTVDSGAQVRFWPNWEPNMGFYTFGFQSLSASLSQTTPHTFQADTTYTFSIEQGSGFEGYNQQVILSLLRADTNAVVASATHAVSQGTAAHLPISVIFDSSIDPSVIGQNIIVSIGTLGAGNSGTSSFDLASLEAVTVPEPTTLAMGAVGLFALSRCARRRRRAHS